MGLTVLSVSNVKEAATLLSHLVNCREKIKNNKFKHKQPLPPPHKAVLSATEHLPGLGPKRAKQVNLNMYSVGSRQMSTVSDDRALQTCSGI